MNETGKQQKGVDVSHFQSVEQYGIIHTRCPLRRSVDTLVS